MIQIATFTFMSDDTFSFKLTLKKLEFSLLDGFAIC